MPKPNHNVADRRWRKVYESIIDGYRINQLPYDAQVFFWKIQHIADDFGNFKLLPAYLAATLYPESPEVFRPDAARVSEMVAESVATKNKAGFEDPLVKTYTIDGDTYAHICEYLLRQSPSNGVHQHRVPASPWDAAEYREWDRARQRPKGAKENPRKPKPAQDNQSDIQTKNKNKTENKSNNKSKRGIAADVAGFVLSGAEEADAKTLSERPDWLKDGQGWFELGAAREIIAMRLPRTTIAATVRAAKRTRLTLDNPAGWVRSELRKAAEGLKAVPA